MFKHIFLHITCLILLLCMYGAQIAARRQGTSGEIRGTVSDPSGALIPSAQIVLSAPAGSSKTVTGGRDGNFSIGPVEPGTYTLTISAEGFAPVTVDNVQITAGKTVQEKITLQLPVEE